MGLTNDRLNAFIPYFWGKKEHEFAISNPLGVFRNPRSFFPVIPRVCFAINQVPLVHLIVMYHTAITSSSAACLGKYYLRYIRALLE